MPIDIRVLCGRIVEHKMSEGVYRQSLEMTTIFHRDHVRAGTADGNGLPRASVAYRASTTRALRRPALWGRTRSGANSIGCWRVSTLTFSSKYWRDEWTGTRSSGA